MIGEVLYSFLSTWGREFLETSNLGKLVAGTALLVFTFSVC